ncbi:MAG TPA: hypothetical protein VNS09_19295 [Solirubrobacter sp.]|nr:hypothetical protein [Solirubrobacter sp.]
MTDKTRIRIAGAVTAVFLAGISVAGLAARHDQPRPPISAAQPTAATPEHSESARAVQPRDVKGDEDEREDHD